MKRKSLRLVIPILIVLSITVLFLFQGSRQQTTSEEATDSNSFVSRIKNTVRFGKEAQEEKVYDDPWEEWIDKETEEVFAAFLKINPDWYKTDEEKAALWERLRAQTVAHAEDMKRKYGPVPIPMITIKAETTTGPAPLQIHEGPQTPEALMETFDAWYSKKHPNRNNVDGIYPRAEWLQMILNKGYHIETHLDYAAALRTRYWIAEVADQPEIWASGKRAVPPTDDFETYKDAFIKRQFWQKQQVDLAEQADPEVSGGFFFDDRPDVFLPSKKNRLYVYRNPESLDSMKTWGPSLTEEQRFDLTYRGKPPEGWEVIYLDENYNTLSEKPPHVTREMVRAAQLPPEDWTPPEGWAPPEGFEDYLRERGWNGTWTQQPATENSASQNRAMEAREAAKAEWKAAETEWKQFEQMLQDFETFTNMSDTEKAAALQKRFMPQLPEHLTDESIENMLQAQWDPTRIKKAEDLLNLYGPEEGLRRLAKSDPQLAKQVERALGKQSNQPQETGRSIPKAPPPPTDSQPSSEVPLK
ncbi:hypothetical protein F4009_14850 [Candidatus Poribacteria bacterium]|nr:hypothetical protein [Candidatus Poribacteria bacterium]MYK95249.1 hypothetical protein [Candidatus Poribacteria bacterium]